MNVKKFMEYMKNEFPQPLENHFTYNLLENLCDYVNTNYHTEKERLTALLFIVPEIEKRDLWPFMED